MRKHMRHAKTVEEQATRQSGAIEFFESKLAYETGPFDVKEMLEGGEIALIDVRDQASFDKEHIPGALNVPLEQINEHLAKLPRDKVIVTYCWTVTCHLATRAALELAKRGYKVQEMVGGIEEWKQAEFPLEAAKKEAPNE